MERKIRVGLVGGLPLFRQGMLCVVSASTDIEIVAQGETTADANDIVLKAEPDVLVLDLGTPGEVLSIIDGSNHNFSSTRILVTADPANDEQVRLALRSGAHGCLFKGAGGSELLQAVRAVGQGDYYVSPKLSAQLLMQEHITPSRAASRPDRLMELTQRENQILSILVQGHSNKEIGNHLHLNERTVKRHVSIILKKLKVRSRMEAALVATGRIAVQENQSFPATRDALAVARAARSCVLDRIMQTVSDRSRC
jgi:two-component system, NarL family, nitrate/nitrite response regulator NarL